MKELSYELLNDIALEYGEAYYLLDSMLFKKNYCEMLTAFRKYYKGTYIAYSYKTNYTPKLCKIINENGGYAEIVSEMEMWLALKIGVNPQNIYYNGPYKKKKDIEKLLILGGYVNIDSWYEVELIKQISKEHPDINFKVGVRCNIDIGQEEASRFGFDLAEGTFEVAVKELNSISNLSVVGLHCHLPFRSLESFNKRIDVIKKIVGMFPDYPWEYVSLGGGYMGKVDEDFAKEFSFTPPTYDDYATVVADGVKRIFQGQVQPRLIIEPGSALVANAMCFVTKVLDIKSVKGKKIAMLTGSSYNMNPTVKGVKRPIRVFGIPEKQKSYIDLNMAGYTCIESDYLYKNYTGMLGKNDFVVFKNVGSYSVVMKPPFILPDVAMLEINEAEETELVNKEQKIDEIFSRFSF